MKSAVFYGRHDIRIENRPIPAVGAHDVLIQVKACGVCGTDVHIFEGDKGAAETHPPTVLGHEFSGVIADTGSAVTRYRKGTACASIPITIAGHANSVATVWRITART